MARQLFIVSTYAVPGREDEFEQWYRERHLPDMLRVPGVVAAQRYATEPVKLPQGMATPDCIAIYELDCEDPAVVLSEAGRRMGTPEMPSSPALDSARTIAVLAAAK
jgi:hypothetical protein